ncbi:hypothetical protein ACQKE9_16530 [Shewanella vesiculosa]|uniref:hypothetical protein n=1 Tax=Shewanella vesiculosa TaxID=518738 RepID=UPI003D023969
MALRPHQTKRKQTAVPSLLFIKELAQLPATFSLFTKQQLRKVAMGGRFNFDLHLQTASAHHAIKSENTIASDGTSDMNGFTNVVMAGCQGTTCTTKASGLAHALFYKKDFNGLKFKAEFRLFQSRNLNHLWTKMS